MFFSYDVSYIQLDNHTRGDRVNLIIIPEVTGST